MFYSGTSSIAFFLRTVTIGTAAACCFGLTGCVGLISSRSSGQPSAENSPATPPSAASALAANSGKPKVGTYVDPMVTLKQHSVRPTKPNAAATQIAHLPTETQSAEVMAQTQPPQNSLANVIQQPTAVQAGNNSIFAIANAKVAESQGVPAYAPVRNINPIAGSVFSSRTGVGNTVPAPAGKEDKNGLW